MLSAVAKRYAAALFEIARDARRIELLDKQTEMLQAVFAAEDVLAFFNAPQVTAQAKKGVIDKRLSGVLDPALVNLLKVLVDHGRMNVLPEILEYFNLMTDAHCGVEDVTIVSAVPLEQAQLDAITAEMKRFSAVDNLRVKTEVDDGIIGGVKVLLGSNFVIDGTVSTRLRELRDRLVRYRHRGVGA